MPSKVRGSDNFESDDLDFTIIYPNGGTEGSPANISNNSRYVETNPFPGHSVKCLLEVLSGGEWGTTGWAYAGSTAIFGARCGQLDDGDIIIVVGETRPLGNIHSTGHLFPANDTSSSLPCRVKVWKVKGATA